MDNNSTKIIFYICFSFSCISMIYLTITLIYLLKGKENILIKLIPKFIISSIFFWIIEIIVIFHNSNKYKDFWKNCPFLMENTNYHNFNSGRICQIYNINKNSRYIYQYICTYDSSKEFQNKITYKINTDNVVCVAVKSLIRNNIVYMFHYLYKKYLNKFYCSRATLPKKYEIIKNKDCRTKIYSYMVISYILTYLRIFIFLFIVKMIRKKNDNNNDYLNLMRRLNELLANINIQINRGNNSNNSTRVTEKSNNENNEENFVKQNTKNIIVENNEEFSIDGKIINIDNKNNIKDIRLPFRNRENNRNNNDRSNMNIINNS